jgi:hypothetical protein
VCLVPDRGRAFTETVEQATKVHRIPTDLLEQLLDLGLPHRDVDSGRRFDALDLGNVGLELGLPCPRRLAMRWWAKSLASFSEGAVRYHLALVGQCPSSGHDGPCDFNIHSRAIEVINQGSIGEHGPGLYEFDVDLVGRSFHFGPEYSDLVKWADALQFHLMPVNSVGSDLGLLAETGLADCRLAAMYLYRAATAAGMDVRPALGYFVAPPYAQSHVWIELRIDGEWWPADPFLLRALARWGIVDTRQWPTNRTTRGLTWRIKGSYFYTLSHRGTGIYSKLAVLERTSLPPSG